MIIGRFAFHNGVDIRIKHSWYGFHYYWQSIPLFGIIACHRKLNIVYEYGIIVLGL
jgi:hypothetical protein